MSELPPTKDAFDWITAAGAAAVVVWGAIKLLRGGLVAMWNAVKSIPSIARAFVALPQLVEQSQKQAAMEQIIARIHKEVTPNGGASLRDAVSRQGIELTAALQAQAQGLRRVESAVAVLSNSHRVAYDMQGRGAVFECDPEGLNSYTNHVYQQWTGRSESQLMGMGWVSCIFLEDREGVRDEWESAVEDGREFRMRYRLVDAAQQPFRVEAHASPVRDHEGVIAKWVGVMYRVDDHYLPEEIPL
jgi:PAS domain-containing protein